MRAIQTLVTRSADALREEILAGQLAPGSRVHLTETAERLGVSPVPLREALAHLVGEGLIIQLPQRGYRISPMSIEDFDDTYEMLMILDPLATARAVPRLDAQRLTEIEESLEQLVEAYGRGDWTRYQTEHRRFHFGIYEAAGSPWLLRMLGLLWQNSLRYHQLGSRTRGSLDEVRDEHQRIFDACKHGDATGAADLMREHLQLIVRYVHELLEQRGDQQPVA